MSIISYGVNRGLLQLDSNGVFIQFFAAPKILVSVTEWVASLFQSKEQTAKIRNVAAEYVNVAMDSRGFIYTAATDTTSVSALRKLSFDGTDVLNQTDAKFTVIGDVETTDTTSPQIVDVAVNDEANTYTVLDARMGRFSLIIAPVCCFVLVAVREISLDGSKLRMSLNVAIIRLSLLIRAIKP